MCDWMLELLDLPTASARPVRAGRHPGDGVGGHPVRHPGGARAHHRGPGQPGRGHRPAGGLRHRPGPLVDREGAAHRRHRQRQPPPGRRRRHVRHAHRRPRRRRPRRPRRRPRAVLRERDGGHDLVAGLRSRARHRRGVPAEGLWLHVDAAMAGMPRSSRAPMGQRRRRAGRLVLHQPAQVDGHQLRLRSVLSWPTARRCWPHCRSCPSTCARRRDAGAVVDYRDWQIPLGRRFRALKVWFTLLPTAPSRPGP